MIAKMRAITPIVMWIVIITFIGGIFFLWGMDITGKSDQAQFIGKVDGQKIPLAAFERQVSAEREKLRQQYESEIPAYQNKMVPRQVWENEISRYVYNKLLKKMHLSASADEIYNEIKNNPPEEVLKAPVFQTDSVFDSTKFVQWLNNPTTFDNQGMVDFESYVGAFVVPMSKLRSLIEVGNLPSRLEASYEHEQQSQRAQFEYVRVNWVGFSVDRATISEQTVKTYYETHKDSFATEAQSELSYVRIPKKATAADEALIQQEILDLKKRIESKEFTFSAAAKVESDDEASAQKEGDLGWFYHGSMMPEFEAVAFSLPVGVISDPVRTSYGYHLVLVEEKTGSRDSVKIKARHILRKVIPSVETLDSLESYVEQMRNNFTGKSLREALVQSPGLQLDSTGLFKRGEFVQVLADIYGVAGFAFSGKQGDLSDKAENTDAFYLFQIKRKVAKGIVPLADASKQIVDKLVVAEQKKIAHNYLSSLIAKVPQKDALALYNKVDSTVISGVTDTVFRTAYVNGIGQNNNVVAAAFSLPIGKVSDMLEAAGSLYLVKPVYQSSVEPLVWGGPQAMAILQTMQQKTVEKYMLAWYLGKKRLIPIESELEKHYLD